MDVLVTGGAGFIGRWVAKRFLDEGHDVTVLDNLSNGSMGNVNEFKPNPQFSFVQGSVTSQKDVSRAFGKGKELCVHMAAQINVQESLESPEKPFNENVIGTYNVLEECRKSNTKIVLVGTCMVYDLAAGRPISESHAVKPASPYAATKLMAEELALSYHHSYGLPVVVTRPFNTYGPFQKSNSEGGVVSVFIKKQLEGRTLMVYGDGSQTRDLLYVEDCADFIFRSSVSEKAVGQVINGGTGHDISINDLALKICGKSGMIKHVQHIHQQSEIMRLVCDCSKAKRLLGWSPSVGLDEGIKRTREWISKQ